MKTKLKYALPLMQVALAMLLICLREQRGYGWEPHSDPFAFIWAAINLPAAIAGSFVGNLLSWWWDKAFKAFSTGLLWYWVGLNLESWLQRRTVVMFSWPPLRILGDAIFVAIGAFFGYHVPQVATFADLAELRTSWSLAFPHLALFFGLLGWSSFLIFFFGRDLLHCALRRNMASAA